MVKGDKCWIVENGNHVTQAEILSFRGNLCLIRLLSGAVLRVPRHRLYESEESAKGTMPKQDFERKYRSPYDYM